LKAVSLSPSHFSLSFSLALYVSLSLSPTPSAPLSLFLFLFLFFSLSLSPSPSLSPSRVGLPKVVFGSSRCAEFTTSDPFGQFTWTAAYRTGSRSRSGKVSGCTVTGLNTVIRLRCRTCLFGRCPGPAVLTGSRPLSKLHATVHRCPVRSPARLPASGSRRVGPPCPPPTSSGPTLPIPQVSTYSHGCRYLHYLTTVPPTYMYLPPVAHVVPSSGIDTSLPIVASHDNLQPIIRRPSLSLHPTPLARTRARARMPCPVSACEARARPARDGRECKEGDVSHSR